MEFKGAKGKWIVKHSETKDSYNVVGTEIGERYKIARCPYIKLSYTDKDELEAKSNALLISKAPELLDFIKTYYKFLRIEDQEKAIKLIKQATQLEK